MDLPRVTFDDFLSFEPCWMDDERGCRRLRYYARKLGGSADALEILALRRMPADDRLWAVLREEIIPAPILHEIACRCADDALSRIDIPDPRSINAIAVKRRWIAGEATDDELAEARDAAEAAKRDAWAAALDAATAAARAAAWAAARAAAWAAARAAEWAAARDARDAATAAARAAAWAAAAAALDAWAAAWAKARDAQIDMIAQMLREYVAGDRR